jgi:hypothetical protein
MAVSPETQKLLDELDAELKGHKERDVAGQLRRAAADLKDHVSKMERDAELLLNIAGKQLKEEALAEARRVDLDTQMLDTIEKIDREDDKQDEMTRG